MQGVPEEGQVQDLPPDYRQKEIQKALLEKFKKKAVLDPETGEFKIIEAASFDQLNLAYNCNRVSEVVQKTIGGERYRITVNGQQPSITFSNGQEIASGHTQAIHSLVVLEGKVYDPITGVYGDKSLEEYMNELIIHGADKPKIERVIETGKSDSGSD
jgi:hypothetical protein